MKKPFCSVSCGSEPSREETALLGFLTVPNRAGPCGSTLCFDLIISFSSSDIAHQLKKDIQQASFCSSFPDVCVELEIIPNAKAMFNKIEAEDIPFAVWLVESESGQIAYHVSIRKSSF